MQGLLELRAEQGRWPCDPIERGGGISIVQGIIIERWLGEDGCGFRQRGGDFGVGHDHDNANEWNAFAEIEREQWNSGVIVDTESL